MALIIPIVAGISGIISGLCGGYYLFGNNEEQTRAADIKDTGVINNSIQIDETKSDNELMWILRIILTVLLIMFIVGILVLIRRIVKKRNQNNNATKAKNDAIPTIEV